MLREGNGRRFWNYYVQVCFSVLNGSDFGGKTFATMACAFLELSFELMMKWSAPRAMPSSWGVINKTSLDRGSCH